MEKRKRSKKKIRGRSYPHTHNLRVACSWITRCCGYMDNFEPYMKKKVISAFNLPVIKDRMPEAKRVSLDDYLRFVEFNLKYTVDIDVCRRQKRIAAVDVPFQM